MIHLCSCCLCLLTPELVPHTALETRGHQRQRPRFPASHPSPVLLFLSASLCSRHLAAAALCILHPNLQLFIVGIGSIAKVQRSGSAHRDDDDRRDADPAPAPRHLHLRRPERGGRPRAPLAYSDERLRGDGRPLGHHKRYCWTILRHVAGPSCQRGAACHVAAWSCSAASAILIHQRLRHPSYALSWHFRCPYSADMAARRFCAQPPRVPHSPVQLHFVILVCRPLRLPSSTSGRVLPRFADESLPDFCGFMQDSTRA